ncbi:MAG: Ppx/GppA family phosphatase, partial [Gemmatimonas sp.]
MNDDTRLQDQLELSGELQRPVAARPGPGLSQASGTSVYAALDLGTNNCRLLIACPSDDGFRVVDSFSRIIRLGEGVAATGS